MPSSIKAITRIPTPGVIVKIANEIFYVEHSAQCQMPNKKERNMIFLLTSITLDSHVSGD